MWRAAVLQILSSWDLVFSSYIRTYQNLGLVVRLSWAPMLVGNIVLSIIVVAAEQITSTLWRLILELCFIFILVPFAAIVLVAWHRFILLDEKPEGHWFYFAASKRERLFIFGQLAILAVFLPQLATGSSYLYLMVRKANLGGILDQGDILWAAILNWSWLIVLFPIMARLIWVLPEIAIDKGFDLRRCWRLTRGNTWRLTIGLVLVSTPFYLFGKVINQFFVYYEITQDRVIPLLYFFAMIVGITATFFAMIFGMATTATYVSLTYKYAAASNETEKVGKAR